VLVVQRAAGVLSWYVFNNAAVRAEIETATNNQRAVRAHQPASVDDRTLAGLRAELAAARAEIRDLRSERERLRQRLARDLGQQIDALGRSYGSFSADSPYVAAVSAIPDHKM
jgi:hypothetical protein